MNTNEFTRISGETREKSNDGSGAGSGVCSYLCVGWGDGVGSDFVSCRGDGSGVGSGAGVGWGEGAGYGFADERGTGSGF